VIILANSDDPDSLRIARHYADSRGVPKSNVIALSIPHAEAITWREFVATVWQPLLDSLVRTGWIDAIPMGLTDPLGRRKYAPQGHRIAALVVCRGVPLKIAHDPALYAEAPPYTSRPEFRTNAGAVDAELSLLAQPNYPINAFLPNPLFQNERPRELERRQVVKVARLDGPTAADALALIDHALAAERHGLAGRAYLDFSDRDPLGNRWLEEAAAQLAALHFDTSLDRDPATMPAGARFDAPVVYFGWYAGDLNGPFALPGFRFPPGAIALHIHSYSAATLRSARSGWAGPLIARGVTATFGNVHEPYLQFTHQPHLLLRALARGARLIDAAYFSLPVLSWQAVVIGDPLYRPFAVSLGEQLRPGGKLPPQLTPYAVLRRMRELEAAGNPAEAIAFANAAQRDAPSLPVWVALAERLHAAGKRDLAAPTRGRLPGSQPLRPDEWGLAREAARWLERVGDSPAAMEVWRGLFALEMLPRELRLLWLPEARPTALAANDAAQAAAWQAQIDELSAPPAK
jgi:uncharacterized protein (TIGR03790 family)